MERLRIIINEDMPSDFELLEYMIRKAGFDLDSIRVDTREAFLAALRTYEPDIIISDYCLPKFTGMEALELATQHAPYVPFIIVTGSTNEMIAVECMKAGADDYVLKDHLVRIGPTLVAAVERKRTFKEKMRTEQRLIESERRFRALFQNANDAIFLLGQDTLIDCNPEAMRMFGLTHDKLSELAPFSLSLDFPCEGDLSQMLTAEKIRAVLQGNPQSFEWHYTRSDGARFDLEVALRAMEVDGKPVVIAIMRDITERKRIEGYLRDNEEKFRSLSQVFNALLDAIPDGITLYSSDLKVVWANRAASDNPGEDAAELAERDTVDLVHHSLTPAGNNPVMGSFRTGETFKEIITLTSGRTWEVRTVPVKDQTGEVCNVIKLGRDMSELKKLEQQLIHAQKMEAIGQLAGGIAHDFNNILTALIGYGNLLLMGMADDDPARHFVEQMLMTTDRAAELTQGLLTFSRKKTFYLQPVDLNYMLSNMLGLLERIIGEEIEIKANLSTRELIINADANQIEQVIMNIVTNARDAMPEGGDLTISVYAYQIDDGFTKTHGFGAPGIYTCVELTDNGIGMEGETLKKIFDPFFTTKEAGKGTGLGLAIVYGIVKEHKGYITVYSSPGMGATFRIYLPLADQTLSCQDPHELQIQLDGTETVLVAEDDTLVRETLSKLLKGYGYTVIEAVDGQDALEKFIAAKDATHIMILDVLMPKIGGREVADTVLQMNPRVKALFCSGYPLELLQKKGILGERVYFFTKPVAPRELLLKVREVLDG